jgi:hypothetical protein
MAGAVEVLFLLDHERQYRSVIVPIPQSLNEKLEMDEQKKIYSEAW